MVIPASPEQGVFVDTYWELPFLTAGTHAVVTALLSLSAFSTTLYFDAISFEFAFYAFY
jgi:hypothetical protein